MYFLDHAMKEIKGTYNNKTTYKFRRKKTSACLFCIYILHTYILNTIKAIFINCQLSMHSINNVDIFCVVESYIMILAVCFQNLSARCKPFKGHYDVVLVI